MGRPQHPPKICFFVDVKNYWRRSHDDSDGGVVTQRRATGQCAAIGDERTWSTSTKADAAELVRHSATSRCPRALFLVLTPPSGRGVAPARCARHRHALCTRVSAPQARAHCPLVCLASSCSAISATAMQPSSAAHYGIGRRETRVQARRLRTPVHTSCPIVVTALPLTVPLPPDSSAATTRVPKNKKFRGARRHPDGLGTEHNTQSFSGC